MTQQTHRSPCLAQPSYETDCCWSKISVKSIQTAARRSASVQTTVVDEHHDGSESNVGGNLIHYKLTEDVKDCRVNCFGPEQRIQAW
eukprot:m.503680 g.503680  ORF g.503680 m.503680 type:complete len:87 (-) comp57347_c0_seq34:1272-1532(-)